MPLVRFELKNEYGLGDSRLYQGSKKKEEDPRNILGGFTVSGLVGILRQLGDLAEFASVVFNDVHQQVITTTARGHKVLNRIRKIEVALPQFEKAVQKQKSHIHFAYIAGCEWHTNIQIGKSELYGSGLPEYMMDSYEECHDPPHLHLLDKFDSAGAGACLKRYSDPSYLRKVVANSESMIVGKSHNGFKARRKKKQRSRGNNGLDFPSVHRTLHGRSSAQYAPDVTEELRFSVDDASISDTLSTSNFTNELMYFSSDKRSGCLEVQNTSLSTSRELYDDDLSAIEAETKHNVDCISNNHIKDGASDHVMQDSMPLQNSVFSTSISSDEKIEMVKSINQTLSHDIPEDALNGPKTAELSSALLNSCYGTNGLEMQMKLVSRSMIWDETATMACGKSISSTYSATCDVKNETMEPKSPRFPDGISPSRPPDLDSGQINELTSQMDKDMDETNALGFKVQSNFEYETGQGVLLLPHRNYDAMKCEVNMYLDGVDGDISPFRIQDSKFLFLTLEAANQQCEMTGTEMLNQENVLRNTIFGINELTIQLDKDMDATSGLNFKVKTNFDCQSGQGVILLPHLNYYGIDCEVDKTVGVDSRNTDDVCGDIIPFRPQNSELFLNLGKPNRCSEMTVTEMPNQANFLLNSMKMVAPSLDEGEIRDELTSQIDKHVDATNALDSKVQENFEYQTGGVILLSNQNYDGMECELNKIPGVSTTGIDDVDGEIAYESSTSLIKKTYPQVFDYLQPAGSAEFAHKQHYTFENSVCKNLSSASSMENDSEAIYSNIPSSQTVVIDSNPPEQSSSQDSFGDTSAASQKEALCEHQTKREVESETDSNFRLSEYQSSLEKVIASSKLIDPAIETHVASCSSSNDYTFPFLSGTISFNTVENISSTFSSDVNLSGHPSHVLSPRNVSEDPTGNVSTQLTNTSVISPFNATATTAIEFQGFSVDSHRKSLINIWTNGGLLGLEPSKPPDISVPNVYCSDQIYDNRSSADSQPCMLGNKSESKNLFSEPDKLNHVVSFPEKDNFTGKVSDKQIDSIKQHFKDSVQASSVCKLRQAQNSYFDGTDLHINGFKGKEDGSIFSEADACSKDESESNIGISVGFSSLAHRFPVNSSQRKSSNTSTSPFCELMNKDVHKLDDTSIFTNHKEIPKLAIPSAPLHKLENKDVGRGFSDKFVSSSLDPSGHQSPPLEHMKVSLQPMNISDSSKLRLEFCNIHLPGNTGDLVFPSFQLLSESFHPQRDDALESDDDTFCRSCPYSSDDLLTLYSDSDDETWGEEDGLDVSNRIEATCSISSSIDDESNASRISQANHVANSKKGSEFNLSGITYLPNAFSSQRLLNTCNSSTEPPNELQPTQLRVLKPSSAIATKSFSSHHL